jgi:hypothetical protein
MLAFSSRSVLAAGGGSRRIINAPAAARPLHHICRINVARASAVAAADDAPLSATEQARFDKIAEALVAKMSEFPDVDELLEDAENGALCWGCI